MLDALVNGERDPVVLADLAKTTLRRKTPPLQQALLGRFDAHHAILVREMQARIDAADATWPDSRRSWNPFANNSTG